MGGYDLDEYDEYEDDGDQGAEGGYEEEEEEEEEEGEEEKEEDRLPTQEELEYLELRQKLKESIRKKMKKEVSASLASAREKKNKMPYDNFGSFFGPSQPVIAQRVIQESKSLLENPHLAAKALKAKNDQNKGGSSASVGSRPRLSEKPRVANHLAKPKAKIQMLKDKRDYSFLLSDDVELPASTKNPPRRVSSPRTEAHLSQRTPNNSGRKVNNGHVEKKQLPSASQLRAKPGLQSQKPNITNKLNSLALDSRKQMGRNDGSGPGRPSAPKALPLKMPVVRSEKAISAPVSKGSMPGVRKPLPSKPLPAVQKKPLEQKRDDRESSRKTMIKKPVLTSKPQVKQQPAKLPSSAQKKERPQKKPMRSYAEDDDSGDNAISMIRSMFRYNPSKYRGIDDDDDSDMEARFDDILREEQRSARIAAKEDEEELRKIEEEERREQMRKAAKKRKLSQR